jgi:hypothetical protein
VLTTISSPYAAFAFLVISASINTVAKADELKRVSANGTVLAYVELGQGEPVTKICRSLSRHCLQPPQQLSERDKSGRYAGWGR